MSRRLPPGRRTISLNSCSRLCAAARTCCRVTSLPSLFARRVSTRSRRSSRWQKFTSPSQYPEASDWVIGLVQHGRWLHESGSGSYAPSLSSRISSAPQTKPSTPSRPSADRSRAITWPSAPPYLKPSIDDQAAVKEAQLENTVVDQTDLRLIDGEDLTDRAVALLDHRAPLIVAAALMLLTVRRKIEILRPDTSAPSPPAPT